MVHYRKTRTKTPEFLPPTSPVCMNALDLDSVVSSYTARTLTALDIPQIPVYNREKNKIQRFSRILSVPQGILERAAEKCHSNSRVVSCLLIQNTNPSLSPRPAAPQTPKDPQTLSYKDLPVFPTYKPIHHDATNFMPLGAPPLNKRCSTSDYSETSSIPFSDNSVNLPTQKRNSTFDSQHRSTKSASSFESGPSNILHVDLTAEHDSSSFYEYYFNKLYFNDTDSLFSSVQSEQYSQRTLPQTHQTAASEALPKAAHSKTLPPAPVANRRLVSEVPLSTHTRLARKAPPDFCLDLGAEYEKSRFMIPESHQVHPHRREIPIFRAEDKALPMTPEKNGLRKRISSEAKHRFTRIFSK